MKRGLRAKLNLYEDYCGDDIEFELEGNIVREKERNKKMIKHIKCDIFESGADIICHQVNCQGVMGSGIAKTVRERYPKVYEEYKEFCKHADGMPKRLLGLVQPISISNNDKFYPIIVNLFAQENFGYDGKCYTDYTALRKCFEAIQGVSDENTTIAFPYLMGCHRGGGDWNVVYKMIEEVFANSNCEVLICEYNGG